MITCPKCNGDGVIRALAHMRPIELECRHCKGTGKVPKEMLAWIEHGKELHAERIVRRVTLRDEALNTGIDVMVISDRERGVVDNGKEEASP